MVIILVALLVLGPEQLPKAMRSFGNVMTQVRKVSGGFQAELRSVMDTVTDGIDPTKPAAAATPAAPSTATDGDEKPQSAPMASPGPRAATELADDAGDVAGRPTADLVDRAAG